MKTCISGLLCLCVIASIATASEHVVYEDYEKMEGLLRIGPEPERQIPPPPPPELFNLAADPLEKLNVADQHPDRVARMLQDLESWFEEVESERATIDDQW